jgi:hypothetical protein
MAANVFLGWFKGLVRIAISDGSWVDFCKYLGWFKGLLGLLEWFKGLVTMDFSDGSLPGFE